MRPTLPDISDAAAQQGKAFGLGPDQAIAVAQQMARAGTAPGNIEGALQQQFAFATNLGMPRDDASLTRLTSTLSVQGGMDTNGLSQLFQQLSDISKIGGQGAPSVLRLVDALQSLVTATGTANVNVSGLAAVQSKLGPAFNAGQVLAPAIGASGLQAVQTAGVLGVSADRLAQLQKDPAALYTQIGQFAAHIDPSHTRQGAEIAAGVLQDNKLINMQGLSPQRRVDLVNDLIAGRTGDAERLTGVYTRRATAARTTPERFAGGAAKKGEIQTGLPGRATIEAQNIWRDVAQYGQNIVPNAVTEARRGPGNILSDTWNTYSRAFTYATTNTDPGPRPRTFPGVPATPNAGPSLFDPLQPIGDTIGGLASAIGGAFDRHDRAVSNPRHVVGSDESVPLITRRAGQVAAGAAGGPGNWQTDSGGGSWGTPPPQRLDITVTVRDSSGRQMGQSSVSHTLSQSRVAAGRTVIGGRSHGPGR